MKKSLSKCPTCGKHLKISQYHCSECEIDINGEFEGCMFCNLRDEDRYFALVFLQTGGSIKDVERVMGISYPTVKAKLAQLVRNLGLSNGGEPGCYQDDDSDAADRASLKAEVRAIKRKVREEVRGNLRRAFHGEHHRQPKRFSFHLNVDKNESASKPSTKDVIDELKAGNIDVAAALRRLRGEKEETVESNPGGCECGDESSGVKMECEIKIEKDTRCGEDDCEGKEEEDHGSD